MKKSLHYLFIVFLFIYALFIGWHAREITWIVSTTTLFICGITLAFFAHARKNYLTILILLVHMGIEWFEWSHQKLSFTQELFNLAHAAMDITFLSHELRVHVCRQEAYSCRCVSSTGLDFRLWTLYCNTAREFRKT